MIRPESIKPCFDCKLCSLRRFARRPVWGRGPEKPLFILVGEGPGREEDATGIPFHPEAPAGSLITAILEEIGVKRSEVYITNATRCYKGITGRGGGVIEEDHIKACKPYLKDELEKIDCEYIVPAGNEALKATLGHVGITKEHGRLQIGPNGKKYFPILHPASALNFRNPENYDKIRDALRELVAKIRQKQKDPLFDFDCRVITTDKMLDEFERRFDKALRNDDTLMFFDFETNSKLSPFIIGPENFIISGCAFSWEDDLAWYLPIDHQNPIGTFTGHNYERCKEIIRRFAKSNVQKGNQNIKYEYQIIHGIFGIRLRNMVSDPMLESHWLLPKPGTHGLDVLAWQVGMGGYDLALEQWFIDNKISDKKRDYTKVPLDILGRYACGDVICARRYHQLAEKKIRKRKQEKFFLTQVMGAVAPYAEMESYGLLYDSVYMKQLDRFYRDAHKQMRIDMRGMLRKAGRPVAKDFNFDSSEQIATLLHDWLGLETLRQHQIKKKQRDAGLPRWQRLKASEVSKDPADYVKFNKATKKKPSLISTGQNTLSGLLAYYKMSSEQRALILTFREYRSGRTRWSRNVKGMKKHVCADGRVRSSLLQHGTATGRRSSKDPNQQNIPRDAVIKRGFVSAIFYLFVIGDYKNLEVRIAAAISADRALVGVINSGKDIHSYLGSRAYDIDYDRMMRLLHTPWEQIKKDPKLVRIHKRYSEYRARAKVIWWVLLFGGSANKIAESAGIPYDEAARLQQFTYGMFPGLQDMFEELAAFASRTGYSRTDYGRRRYLDGVFSTDERTRADARRQALNSPIQGTASDVTLRAVRLLYWRWRELKLRAHNVQEVHDAITQEVHYRDAYQVMVESKRITEGITSPSSKGKLVFETDMLVGCHLGTKLKVDKKILEMAKNDPKGLYELCRSDLDHPPSYYAG